VGCSPAHIAQINYIARIDIGGLVLLPRGRMGNVAKLGLEMVDRKYG
jgi:hypothetical protein